MSPYGGNFMVVPGRLVRGGSTGAFCVLGLNSPFTHYYCWHAPTLTSLSTHSLCDRFAVTRRASLSCYCDIAVCLGARRRSYLVSVWHLQRCGTPLLVGLHSPIAAAGSCGAWAQRPGGHGPPLVSLRTRSLRDRFALLRAVPHPAGGWGPVRVMCGVSPPGRGYIMGRVPLGSFSTYLHLNCLFYPTHKEYIRIENPDRC